MIIFSVTKNQKIVRNAITVTNMLFFIFCFNPTGRTNLKIIENGLKL